MSSFPTASVGQCPGLSSWEQTASHSTGPGLPDWPAPAFAICPQFYTKTASNSFTSQSLLSILPSGSSYSSIFLVFRHKFGLAAVSYVLVFIFWFYALVFFIHFWPGSPLNWSSIRQIVTESLLCCLGTGLDLQCTSVDQTNMDPLGWGRARRSKWLDKYTDTESFKCHGGKQQNGSPHRFEAGG